MVEGVPSIACASSMRDISRSPFGVSTSSLCPFPPGPSRVRADGLFSGVARQVASPFRRLILTGLCIELSLGRRSSERVDLLRLRPRAAGLVELLRIRVFLS